MLRSDSRVSGRKPDSRSLEAQEAALPEAAAADARSQQAEAAARQRNVSGAATPEAARARRTTSSDLASLNVELPEQWYEPSDAWLPPLPPVHHAPASSNAPSARAPGRDAQPAARAGLHPQPPAAHDAESRTPQPATERGWRSHDWQRAHSPEQSWRTQEWQAQSYTARNAPALAQQRERPAAVQALASTPRSPQRSAEPPRSSRVPSSHAASASPEREAGDRKASRVPSSHAASASPERGVGQPARAASSPLVATASSARTVTAQSRGPSARAVEWQQPSAGAGSRGPASSASSQAADFYAAPSESNWAQELASEVAEIEYESEPEAMHAQASPQSWPSHTADSQVTGRYAGLSEQKGQSHAPYAHTQPRDYASQVAAIGYEAQPQHGEPAQDTLQLDELSEADAHYEHTPVGSWRRNASGVLEPRPTTMRPRHRRSWTAPITAAVVVLAVVLGYSAARIQSWREKQAPQLTAAPAQVELAPPATGASAHPSSSLETTREPALDPTVAPAPHNLRAAAESSTRAHNLRARRGASAPEPEQAIEIAPQPPAADQPEPKAVATTASSQTAAASAPHALSATVASNETAVVSIESPAPSATVATMAPSQTAAAAIRTPAPSAAVTTMAPSQNAVAALSPAPNATVATMAPSQTAVAAIQTPAPRPSREARPSSLPPPSSSSSDALDRALQPSAAPTGDSALAMVDEVTRTAEARPPAPPPTASVQSAGPQPVLTIRPLDPSSEASAVQPTREQVRDAMLAMQPQLALCAGDKHGTSHANVTIQGNGRVSYSLIDGAFAGTEAGSCMARALRAAIFPTFSGPPFKVRYPLVF